MRVFLNIVKHALLFFLANCFAVSLFLLIIWLISGESSNSSRDIGKLLFIITFFVAWGMLFTFIPYIIALPIIKANQTPLLRYYALGGVFSSLLFCILLLSMGHPILSIIVVGVSAICGLLYGYLDKKIQILPNKKPDAGGSHE